MDTKVYKFKPLYKTSYGDGPALVNLVVIVFAVIFLVAILFFQMPVIYIVIPIFLAIRLKFYKKTASEWDVDGYKTIKIDGHNRFIFLDDLAVPFSDIKYAEVVLDERPSMYGLSNSGIEYFSLVNAEIRLYLNNDECMTIPVQFKSCLKKMIAVLKEYIVVKYDENNKFIKEGAPLWVWFVTAFIIWCIFAFQK